MKSVLVISFLLLVVSYGFGQGIKIGKNEKGSKFIYSQTDSFIVYNDNPIVLNDSLYIFYHLTPSSALTAFHVYLVEGKFVSRPMFSLAKMNHETENITTGKGEPDTLISFNINERNNLIKFKLYYLGRKNKKVVIYKYKAKHIGDAEDLFKNIQNEINNSNVGIQFIVNKAVIGNDKIIIKGGKWNK